MGSWFKDMFVATNGVFKVHVHVHVQCTYRLKRLLNIYCLVARLLNSALKSGYIHICINDTVYPSQA